LPKRNYENIRAAAMAGDARATQEFAKQDPHTYYLPNESGATILHWAASSGNIKLCNDIMRCSLFDVHALTKYGGTVLHFAALSGSLTLCQWLVRCGVMIKLSTFMAIQLCQKPLAVVRFLCVVIS
jgi:ankyrin repeat protein